MNRGSKTRVVCRRVAVKSATPGWCRGQARLLPHHYGATLLSSPRLSAFLNLMQLTSVRAAAAHIHGIGRPLPDWSNLFQINTARDSICNRL